MDIKNEAKTIAEKYRAAEPREAKMEQLRKLDRRVSQSAQIVSLAVGIVGVLVLGLGMCCITVWTDLFAVGIIIGVVGMAICGIAYPIYVKVYNKRKEEAAPQILQLSREITEE